MRKIILIVVIILFILTLVDNKNNDEIRVRIVPNSNSEKDLIIKEKVKESVIYYLSEIYDDNFDEYKDNISNSISDLEKIIDDEFSQCNIDFNYHTLYNKSYNGNKVKDEKTLVLLIVLGAGQGDNWWGSIYPNYLTISSSEEYEYESLFILLINEIRGEKNENRRN
jgi:hypothetical protein